jgi:cobalt-zinc-cadmium efflux system outer membrane protein
VTACLVAMGAAGSAWGQRALTWEEVRHRFEATNPTLQAARIGIDEAKAQEVTAYLRPNPEVTSTIDQLDPFSPNPYRPLANTLPLVSASYLHERQHKRELRLESARNGTAIAESQWDDERRTLLFNLRNSFVQAMQAKAVAGVARESLAYYDRLLAVSGDRFRAGDIARVDFDRLQLQRVQFETDVQTAEVNVRTAKIQLLALMNDRTPVEQFDVTGPFEFGEPRTTLDELHEAALASRPDLRLAAQSVDKAKTDYRLAVANGSTDPTFSMDFGRNPPIPVYMGFSITIPLRIFDRNQGEKARTQLGVQRTERLREASNAQVFSDVDSAWATLNSNLGLLRPYKARYLDLATSVRETVSYAYQHGGSSLLDFLNAQNEYRSTYLNYLNLIGSYLTAANQLNLAVGREVIP